jgi:hypothetical protein
LRCMMFLNWECPAIARLSCLLHHCEPTGPARSGRPDDKHSEAIQPYREVDCFVASLLAMTNLIVLLKEEIKTRPKRA